MYGNGSDYHDLLKYLQSLNYQFGRKMRANLLPQLGINFQ